MRLLISILFALGSTLFASGNIFETQVEQPSSNKGQFGEYRIWLPTNAHPDRILIVVWGANQYSLGIVDNPAWQQLATSLNCALMGGFSYPQTSDNPWDHANEGSGEALLEAIQALAQISGEKQLAGAPFYLVGDSQGGEFAFSLASWRPTRTLGFVSLKGGRHDLEAVQNAAGVPGLFFAGQLDAPFRLANIKEVFSKGRALGAPWYLAVEPRGDHSPDTCAPLVRAYLEALSKAQVDQGGKSAGTSAQRDANSSPGFIANGSWFPDTAFKRDLSAFESGEFKVSSPPLSFKSGTPSTLGEVTPTSEDLGILESGQRSQPFSLTITPNSRVRWDELGVLEKPYLSDERVVKISLNQFAVSCRLSTSNLPLGRFAGVIPLRFKYHGISILGGLNVPITSTVVGDVAAVPPLILLKTSLNGTQPVNLQIVSKKKLPITLLTYQAPLGIKVESLSAPGPPLELRVWFDAIKASPSTSTSGSLFLHLKTDREWVLRVPYIAFCPVYD